MLVQHEVREYLNDTAFQYKPGQYEYYARLALDQALIAFEESNYGIGALAVVTTTDSVSEFPARNAMITGLGITDHAETRALQDIKSNKPPGKTYHKDENEWTAALPEGISVFGTLEPCPMCDCTLTNAGAKLSVSTVLDGNLVEEEGFKRSDGAENAIGEKGRLKPKIWGWIQGASGLTFELLETEDDKLVDLSRRIFEETREDIDAALAKRS